MKPLETIHKNIRYVFDDELHNYIYDSHTFIDEYSSVRMEYCCGVSSACKYHVSVGDLNKVIDNISQLLLLNYISSVYTGTNLDNSIKMTKDYLTMTCVEAMSCFDDALVVFYEYKKIFDSNSDIVGVIYD